MCVFEGIFVRGGISQGTALTSSAKAFGEQVEVMTSLAWYRAAKLEKEHAKYPIIVLTEDVRDILLNSNGKQHYAEPPNHEDLVRKLDDSQGLHYLDYLEIYMCSIDDDIFEKEKVKVISLHKEKIIKAYNDCSIIQPNEEQQKAKKKLSWLAHNYHNEKAKEWNYPQYVIFSNEVPTPDKFS